MKEYFVSFSAAFFLTLSCCLLLYFNQMPWLSNLGGVALAIFAFLRMKKVKELGASEIKNAVAMLLGWALFFVVLAGPVFIAQYPMPSTAIVLGWGIGLMVGAAYHICQRWNVAIISVAIWIAYVCIAIPAWFDYAKTAKSAQNITSII